MFSVLVTPIYINKTKWAVLWLYSSCRRGNEGSEKQLLASKSFLSGIINDMIWERHIIINYIILQKMYQSTMSFDYAYPQAFDVKSETSTEGEQSQFHQDYLNHSHLLPFKGGSSKAKSSLCKNFMEKGFCPYANKCQFAHGPQELRINMEHNRSYKTKGCHAFTKKGHCCYGSRCNFIHQQSSEQPVGKEKWSIIYSNHRETFQDMEQSDGSRLMQLLRVRL